MGATLQSMLARIPWRHSNILEHLQESNQKLVTKSGKFSQISEIRKKKRKKKRLAIARFWEAAPINVIAVYFCYSVRFYYINLSNKEGIYNIIKLNYETLADNSIILRKHSFMTHLYVCDITYNIKMIYKNW